MQAFFEFIRIFGAWFLVVFGWLIVSDQQESRELAKNVSSRLAELRKDLAQIQNIAINHHTTEFEDSRVKDLLRAIGDLSAEISHLKTCGFVGLGTTLDVISLRQAITSKNFDRSTYSKYKIDSKLISEIENTRSSLDRDLMSASHKAISQRRTLRDSVSSVFTNKF